MGDVGQMSGYGLGWALTVALLAWAGIKLDERLGTSPALVLLGTLGGIAAGMITVYMRAMARPTQRESEDPQNGEEHS